MHIQGRWAEFRAYSYYSDHLTWGTFVANAALFILACAAMKIVPRNYRFWAYALGITGLLVCATRGVWISFVGALVIYRIMKVRGFRRPFLMLGGVAASFGIVIFAGSYLLEHVHIGLTSNRLVNRYLTIGTIAARTSAPKIFIKELPRHFLYGGGFGSGYLSAGMDSSLKYTPEQYSHNVLVDLLLSVGVPGLFCLGAFVYFWIKEAFWLIRVCDEREARAIRWMVALFVGAMLSSGINSLSALNFYMYFITGLVTAEWSRKKLAYQSLPPLPLIVRRKPAMAPFDALAPSR